MNNTYLNPVDKEYHQLLHHIVENGYEKKDRTGTGTLSIFGHLMRFNLFPETLPLLTTKKVVTRSVIHELLWFLSGSTNTQYLNDNDVRIWDNWADEDGELGPIYGKQWRNFGGVDQIRELEQKLYEKPWDRRIIVNAYNVGELEDMNLPPCHCFWQVNTREATAKERSGWFRYHNSSITSADGNHPDSLQPPERTLDLKFEMRSWDVFLGGPFNIASYALLMHMLCTDHGFIPGDLIVTSADTHIYKDHLQQVDEQCSRSSKSEPPRIKIRKRSSILDHDFNDFQIIGYDPHPRIKAPIAV